MYYNPYPTQQPYQYPYNRQHPYNQQYPDTFRTDFTTLIGDFLLYPTQYLMLVAEYQYLVELVYSFMTCPLVELP